MDLDDVPFHQFAQQEDGGGEESKEEFGLPPVNPLQADIDRNPDLRAAVAAVQQQQRKADYTDDDINWKQVYEEDKELAEKFARERKWDASQMLSGDREQDTKWCFVCRCKSKLPQSGAGIQLELNNHLSAQYSRVQMLDLLTQLQDIHIRKFLKLQKTQKQGDECHFWCRRAIYNHIHDHNRTQFVNTHVQRKRLGSMCDDLWSARMLIDPLNGNVLPHLKVIPLWMKSNEKYNAMDVALAKMTQTGIANTF